MLALALLGATAVGAAEHPSEILVFAAVSTREAMEEIAKQFQRGTGQTVRFSFGSSSTLARQILAGAPADLFLSADLDRVEQLARAGLVRPSDRRDLLSNQLVVVVPAASAVAIKGAPDLVRLDRIAVADPESVPAGIYARKWLESAGAWTKLKGKLIPALDVRAALAVVEAGSADAAVVYRTDAAISKRVRVAYQVPLAEAPRITYPLARIAGSKQPAAQQLFRFLTGEQARAVFTRFGFIVL